MALPVAASLPVLCSDRPPPSARALRPVSDAAQLQHREQRIMLAQPERTYNRVMGGLHVGLRRVTRGDLAYAAAYTFAYMIVFRLIAGGWNWLALAVLPPACVAIGAVEVRRRRAPSPRGTLH